MSPSDFAQWSLSEWLNRVPAGALWTGVVALAGIFGAGFGLSTWLEQRRRAHLQDQLEALRAAPKIAINIGSDARSLGNVSQIFRFSFEKPEFIHPEILDELAGWLSDALPVFAAVDLEGAMRSNRFVRKVETREGSVGESPWVLAIKDGETAVIRKPFYAYKFIGITESGTHIVQTANSGGGSGVFCSLMFLQFHTDEVVDHDFNGAKTRQRVLLKCIGRQGLGDRYDGIVTYEDGVLTIGSGRRIDVGPVVVEETKISLP